MISTPISTQALPAGTRLEQFVIERVLGSGGFGVTYLATDTRLGRQVVIKENLPAMFAFRDPISLTVAPRHTTGEDADNFVWSLENFSKEAAMLASLDHSGIVQVLHSFEAFGTAYFVMPYVEGETFDELVRQIEKKPFSEEELRGLLDRVLSALDYLHQRRIYHRDIKPGNILITKEGVPVLIDFGSARQRLSELSMTVVESAGYTPFEQLQSRGNVGPWSDLYALGATLVKAMTGETPPKAADRAFDDPYQALATQQVLISRFSAEFLRGVDRALQTRPHDRWQNAEEWMEHLRMPKVMRIESLDSESKSILLAAPELPAVSVSSALPTAPEFSAEPVEAPAKVERAIEVRLPIPLAVEERDFLLIHQMPVRMCWIPPGRFMMGSAEDESGRSDDEIWHTVTLNKGFWIGKFPVTQAQWHAVMGSNASHSSGDNLPMQNVSWLDICSHSHGAGGFLARINSAASNGLSFGLPTEAEWEYACRAGTTTAFNHGRNLSIESGDCESLAEVAWYAGNSGFRVQPVGQKLPNAWGLHDMHGNIAEWCSDFYDAYPNKFLRDPTGPIKGSKRVCRGGSWINSPKDCRSSSRASAAPDSCLLNLGFRLVMYSFST